MCLYSRVGEDEVIEKNMALAQEKGFTTADLDMLPEEERVELIDGRMFYMAAPAVLHQILIGRLYAKLLAHVDQKGGDCQVLVSPAGV